MIPRRTCFRYGDRTVIVRKEAAVTIQEFADKYRLRTRIDSDTTKVIFGKYGQIYEWGEGLLGVIQGTSPEVLERLSEGTTDGRLHHRSER